MITYTWEFSCIDNGGKHQYFTVKAPDKSTAIKKAFNRAEKQSKGDIIKWDCKLHNRF